MMNRGGIWWYNAPLPRRWHRCSIWTTGWLSTGVVHRCACGAISQDGYLWLERNARRKS